jgi:succinate dehydrogenase/fumarate reductase flavoprotein subunit
MGNSLLDIFVFGRRAGISAAGRLACEPGRLTLNHVSDYYSHLKTRRINSVAKSPTLFPEFIVDKI